MIFIFIIIFKKMLRYIRFDYSFKKKYKILLLFSINLILVILIYNIIFNNYNSISNNDISNFINEIKLISKQFKEKDLEFQKELKIFKRKILNIQIQFHLFKRIMEL